jgi:hypothetical protein
MGNNGATEPSVTTQGAVDMSSVKPDNGRDHRAGTEIMQAEKNTRKSGFVYITLLCGGSRSQGLHPVVLPITFSFSSEVFKRHSF